MSEPSGEKPYDPKTWQPEDGDPFKGNGYDRLGWTWRYFFPAPRR